MNTTIKILQWTVVSIFVATLLGLGGWWLSGGRWYVMTTPSMSPHLPVGTLVFTRPLVGEPKVGDIYAFVPPGENDIFMHQIVSGNPTTGFHTKGYLNSTIDPWTITKKNIESKAVAWFPDLGWLLYSLPIWFIVALLWSLVTKTIKNSGQWFGSVAIALAISIPVLLWHFLVNGQIIVALVRNGVMHMYLVSTGILPAVVSIHGSILGVLPAGNVRAFVVRLFGTNHHLLLNLHASLPLWGWIILILICLSPMLRAMWLILLDNQKVSVETID